MANGQMYPFSNWTHEDKGPGCISCAAGLIDFLWNTSCTMTSRANARKQTITPAIANVIVPHYRYCCRLSQALQHPVRSKLIFQRSEPAKEFFYQRLLNLAVC